MPAALALTLVASIASVMPLPARASAATAKAACPASRPDETSAAITARLCGGKVLVVGDESPTSLVYAMPDGSLELTTSMAPVRVQQKDDSWAPVDLTLRENSDGSVSPAMSAFPATFAGAQTDPGEHALASLGSGTEQTSIEWTGTLPTPTLSGNTATYADVRPGMDLVVMATAAGIEQDIILKDRSAIAQLNGLALPMVSKADSSYTAAANGSVALTDHSGHVFAQMPPMLMWDAATDPVTHSPHRVALAARSSWMAATAGRGAGVNLSLTPDATWLNDPVRQFPITLDPTISSLSVSSDTYVQQGSTTSYGGANDLMLGVTSGNNTRAFLNWSMAGLQHAVITSAKVYFFNFYSDSCTQSAATQWDMWYDTVGATGATTYANQPAGVTNESNSNQTLGYSSACNDGWVSIDGKNFFQDAANSGSSMAYMQLRAHDETSTSIGFKQFRSLNAADPSQVPYATITYTSTPVIGSRSSTPTTTCATGSNTPYLASKTPKLTSAVSQGDGSTSTLNFEWWNSNGTTKIGSGSATGVVSGKTGSATVPSGQLSEGTTYEWRVDAASGVATSAWSSWCAFTIDTTAPATAPTVTSSAYPANTWAGGAGVAGSFSFGAGGVSDVDSYKYSLDQAATVSVAAASLGGTGTASITPTANGPHTLTVQSVDRAGNTSPTTTYTFDVGSGTSAGSVSFPATGTTTAGFTQLQGVGQSSTTGVTYQWKRAATDSWANIPTGDVSVAAGGSVASWPEATSGSGNYPLLNWNVRQTLANANTPSGLAGRWLLNDGSGTTCADASGLGHPATASGSLTWSGVHGGSAVFNGTTSQCVTGSTVINTANNFSVGAWVYLTANSANQIIVSESSTQQSGFDLRYNKSSGKWVFARWNADIANAPTFITASSTVTALNTWTHLVGTYTASTGLMTLYVNGVATGTATDTTPFTATGGLVIGHGEFNGTTTGFFTGSISDVQTYTTVLTATQVASLYAGGQAAGTGAAAAGPIQVQAVFTGTGGGTSPPNVFTFDPNTASGASSGVGPGSVNLVTGNLTVSGSDVSISSDGSDLSTARAFNTRQPAVFDGTHMFGPGWISTATIDDASSPYTSLTVIGSLVQVGLPDGSTIGFTATSATAFVSQIGSEDLSLVYASASGGSYTLTNQAGDKVVFTPISGAPTGQFTPTQVTEPGSNQTTTMSWQTTTVDGVTVTRPTTVLAPIPTGVANCSTMVKGCRELTFSYAATTTATGTTQAGWGDYAGRIKSISFVAWDPASSAIKTVAVAGYQYDSNGRLVAAWDPRLDNGANHLWITYGYNADGTLATVTNNAQPAWSLAYTTIPTDLGIGRLASVSRSALSAGTATTTIVYGVPLTTAAGGPYNMDSGPSGSTAQWNELVGPVQATAVFDAGQVPSGNQGTGTMPTSWTRATVTYMDANSRELNTVTPGGYTTSTWYDQYGNVIQALTADDRAEALTAAAGNRATAQKLSGYYSAYSTYTNSGMFKSFTSGPYHQITLADGTTTMARNTSTFTPPTPGTCSCQLPISEVDAVMYWTGGTPDVGTEVDGAEPRTTTTNYAWSLLEPLVTTVDPAGLALATTNTYDATSGLVTSVTTPAGGATTNTPATVTTTYYGGAANATYPECGLHPEWAGLVCRTGPGGQASTGPEIPATETTYDMFDQPTVVTEATSAGVLRTTTNGYDTAERPVTTSIVGAAGTGAAIPTQKNVYDPATGYLTNVQSMTTGTPQTTTGYDTLGRVTSYTDTDGVQSTTSYDLLSRPTTTSDGSQTTTTSYDTGGENRSLATQIADAQVGTITAGYDADGKLLTENWPNGIVVTHQYDETGTATGITYAKPGCGQSDCTLYTETNAIGSSGQIASSSSTTEWDGYTYDADGRLLQVQNYANNNCTTRVYVFGNTTSGRASDRASLTSYDPNSDGTCQQSTPSGPPTNWTYDTADRLKTSGYVYDSLGRTTVVPAADTQVTDGGDLAVTYNVNNLVSTMAQGSGTTASYNLDVNNGRVRSWTDTSGNTNLNHYSNASNVPSWTSNSSSGSVRFVHGFAGLVAASGGTSNVVWQMSDLGGNIVATINNADTGIDSYTAGNEFGAMLNKAEVGANRYAWQGVDQQSSSNPDGVVLMGVRLYNPATGRFLSPDPVSGGNANAYDYCAGDPTNCNDQSGAISGIHFRFSWWGVEIALNWTWTIRMASYAWMVYVPLSAALVALGQYTIAAAIDFQGPAMEAMANSATNWSNCIYYNFGWIGVITGHGQYSGPGWCQHTH